MVFVLLMKEPGLRRSKPKFSTELETLEQEVEVKFYKSSGPGGQRKNKRETAVKIRHIPSGITVIAKDFRFQARNKELAFERLQKKLIRLNKPKPPRIPTKIPKYIKEEILRQKRIESEKKRLREKVNF